MEAREMEMLLASSIHDMKNSIAMILNSVDQLSTDKLEPKKSDKHLAHLRYEASRLNNDLMHLLGVYRMQEQELPIAIDEYEVHEVLHHQFLKNEILLEKSNIQFELDCDEDEVWYFDNELIGGVINNVVVNAVRYCQGNICISARVENQQLCIEINDDGNGYPENMIHSPDKPLKSMDFRTGSTSLGLYFASKVANLHKKGDVCGHVELKNGGKLGGGVFAIYLP